LAVNENLNAFYFTYAIYKMRIILNQFMILYCPGKCHIYKGSGFLKNAGNHSTDYKVQK